MSKTMQTKSISLKNPILLENGQQLAQISLRRPTVGDLMEIESKHENSHTAMLTSAWTAQLSGLSIEEIAKIDLLDMVDVNDAIVEMVFLNHTGSDASNMNKGKSSKRKRKTD